MEKLNLLRGWIMEFPLWEGDLLTDTTDPCLGSCGLFPVGTKVVSRKEDVLGGVRLMMQDTFLLRRRTVKSEASAGWIMEFTAWAQGSAPPKFGENTHLLVEKGKLLSTESDGTAIYEVTVTITYEKEYEYGEN